ncbi:hypothetical protein M4578_12590 [Salipiger sp. P9]|uniref:hypothetical protein n=1 Tax=Salipiger pentaromativorans TaxID=2943193 RepID=UPI0021585624|nr:hypothetical protein [Salipiger pentaromativorans]MCR8548669.1 hypothetical protein [Salipiger pentaromativorans]
MQPAKTIPPQTEPLPHPPPDSGPAAGPAPRQRALPAVELLAMVGLLLGLLYLLTGRWSPEGLAVHPFWLPVLLMAARYGLGWGMAAAILCGGLEIAVLSPGPATGVLRRISETGALPLAWAAAALLVGGMRDRMARQLAAQDKALAGARADAARLEQRAEEALRQSAELRDRAAGLQ